MIKLIHNACPFFFDVMDDCLILQLLQVSVTMIVIFWIFLKNITLWIYYIGFTVQLCRMSLNILLFTISSRKYFVVYFALGPAVYVSLPIWISLIFILPFSWHAWMNEKKSLWELRIQMRLKMLRHMPVSEMISFNIFPFQFTGVLPDVTYWLDTSYFQILNQSKVTALPRADDHRWQSFDREGHGLAVLPLPLGSLHFSGACCFVFVFLYLFFLF